MSKVTQLTDPVTNEKVYPVTFTDNVYLPDGTSLTSFLNRIPLPVGSIIVSSSVQHNAGLHLADGSELAIGGSYDAFCQYVINNQANFEITDLATYQAELDEYGQCGKYVITDTYVKIPKITKGIESANNRAELGKSLKAGIPNITGQHYETTSKPYEIKTSGAFYQSSEAYSNYGDHNANSENYPIINFDAARGETKLNGTLQNDVYGKSDTVQPQATKFYFYIVIGTVTKTDIEVDIDNFLTDFANKADKEAGNITSSVWVAALKEEIFKQILTNEIGFGTTVQQKITGSYTGGFKIGSLIINWGAGNNQTITYKIPFSASNTYRVTTAATSFTSIANNPVAGNYSSTGCTLKFGNGGSQSEIAYIAIGY